MSWKSFVSAGLLCALVSPAFAQVVDPGPDLTVVKGGAESGATQANGNLDDDGNWVWQVVITPDYALVPDSSGTPVTAELGFTSNNTVSAATIGSGFDTLNPGQKIFSWEPDCHDGVNPCSVDPTTHFHGIKIEPIGNDGTINQVSSSLGGPNVTSGTQQYLVIKVAGPTNTNLTSTITVSGAYTGDGRIAQINGMDGSTYLTGNYDDYNGVFTRTVVAGDANMNGVADDGDLNILLSNFNGTGKHWYNGDFTGNGIADDGDLNVLLTNFNATGGVGLGGGGGGGVAVPEPATVALLALVGLGLAGLRRRRT